MHFTALGSEGYCTPSFTSPHSGGNQEGVSGEGRGPPSRSSLAQTLLVCRSGHPLDIPTLEDSPGKISLSQGALVHPEPQWLQLLIWHLSGVS